MASADPRADLTCSVCVDLFKDPVTLPCGHSFCRHCITQTWDSKEDDESTCPECNQRYRRRPQLKRSVRLANLVDYFRSVQSEAPEHGIPCTHCIQGPVPAVKSCLHCEASLCNNHLKLHRKSPEHILCDPTASFGNMKCSVHRKILEYYCSQDSTFICVSCRLDGEHQGHPVLSLSEVSEDKKDKIKKYLKEISQRRTKLEERLQKLQERREKAQQKVDGVTERVTTLFRDIRGQLDDLERRTQNEIFSHNEVIRSISDQILHLEGRKDELIRRMEYMEELCTTDDPLRVLSGEDAVTEDSYDEEDEDLYCGDLDEGMISEKIHTGLSDLISGVQSGIYVQSRTQVLLDVTTASHDVHISQDLTTVTLLCEEGTTDGGADNTQDSGQAFSTRSFSTGRHYWEVETSELGDCIFGVAYPSTERAAGFGGDDKSWCMCKWNVNMANHYVVAHNNDYKDLHQRVAGNRFGIYLDCDAGRLSFYELCVPIRHLHTFTTTFTEPLHAVFSVSNNGDLTPVWITVRN